MIIDVTKSFIELNPIISTSPEIKKLYNSVDKKVADKIMWSIFMIDYPDSKINPKANIPELERILDIKSGYYNIDLEDEVVKDARKGFHRYCLSFEENMYRIQKLKLDELTAYFEDLDLGSDDDKDFEKYIKISDKLDKIWKNYELIRNKFVEKISKTETFGQTTLSKAEQRRQG